MAREPLIEVESSMKLRSRDFGDFAGAGAGLPFFAAPQ